MTGMVLALAGLAVVDMPRVGPAQEPVVSLNTGVWVGTVRINPDRELLPVKWDNDAPLLRLVGYEAYQEPVAARFALGRSGTARVTFRGDDTVYHGTYHWDGGRLILRMDFVCGKSVFTLRPTARQSAPPNRFLLP